MVQFADTEGNEIPPGDDGEVLFDVDLYDSRKGLGPELSMTVPMYFETEQGIYNSAGVLAVPIKDVLEQYLIEFPDANRSDGGEGIEAFAAWLHDYADRLALARRNQVSALAAATPVEP